jgi:hypothetical protein
MTKAVHTKARFTKGRVDIVAIGDLHVLLVPDGDSWIAQGIEIDYIAQGDTPEQAKEYFEHGFTKTIALYLKDDGDITGFLRWAPPEVIAEYNQVTKEESKQSFAALVVTASKAKQLEFPWKRIAYVSPLKAA